MSFSNFARLIPTSDSEMPAKAAVPLDPTAWTQVASFYARGAKAVLLRFTVDPNAGNLSGDDRVEWYLAYQDTSGVTATNLTEVLRHVSDAYGELAVQAGTNHEDFDGFGLPFQYRYFTSSGGGGAGDTHQAVVPLIATDTPISIYMRGRGKNPYQGTAPTITGVEYALSDLEADAVAGRSEREPVISLNNSTRTALGAGAAFNGIFENCLNAGSVTISVFADVASAANGLVVSWSPSGGGAWVTTEVYSVVAGTGLSITIPRRATNVKVDYTNGAAPQAVFNLQVVFNPWAVADSTTGGGGGAPVASGGYLYTKPAPDPSAVLGSTLTTDVDEPDGAKRVRARVLTDEGSFEGYFPGASFYTAIVGNLTLTNTSKDWTRAAATTPLKPGDYIELIADHSDTAPKMAQIDTISADGLSGTLRSVYGGAGGTGAGQRSDWQVGCSANAGDGVAVAGGFAALTLGTNAASRAYIARQLGAGGFKDFAPLVTRFLLKASAAQADQSIIFGLASDPTAAPTQLAVITPKNAATEVHLTNSRDTALGGADDQIVMPDGAWTDADSHLYEVDLFEDQVAYFIDRQRVGNPDSSRRYGQGFIPDPYAGLWVVIAIANSGAGPAGACTLSVFTAMSKSRNVVDARVEQPDASKLNATVKVAGTALADLDALATYLPGMAGDFMGPTAGLVAATPTLLGVASGTYYAVTVDPLGGGPAAVRVLTSRPVAIAGAGLTGCLFTNGVASVTCQNTHAPNVVAGQMVYLAADGAQYAALVTVVAIVGADTVLTLAAAYGGAGGAAGPGKVCGVATAVYPNVPPQSDGMSPEVYGPFVPQDVIIVYADAAYAGAVVGAARSVL